MNAPWRAAQIVVWLLTIALMFVFPDPPIVIVLALVATVLFPFHLGITLNHLPTKIWVESPDEPAQLRLRPYEADPIPPGSGPVTRAGKKDEGDPRVSDAAPRRPPEG